MVCSKIDSKIEVQSKTGLPQKIRKKSQILNLTLHLIEIEKEQMKPRISRRKEIIRSDQ